jgi:DNA-binding transcriptional ArsR family regulator
MATEVVCERVTPSVAAELGWILNLLVQSARYAEPALEELDRTLLPGVADLRPRIKQRYSTLWEDRVAGCPELLVALDEGDGRETTDVRGVLADLSTLPKITSRRPELLSEPAAERRLIRRRIAALDTDIRLRRAYRDILATVWELAEPKWVRRGNVAAEKACREWTGWLHDVTTATELIRLMPARHPLIASDPAAAATLLRRRRRFALVPMYFCMSGGHVGDLGQHLQIGVPGSALEPVRQSRDADFVAYRLRLLAEPTRVRILMHLMSEPAGVMQIARSLCISQPVVSEHIRRLVAAGIVRRTGKVNRTVYGLALPRLERVLEDARSTLFRWA